MGTIGLRERILVYGNPGSGKSYQFLKIAEFVKPNRCYVVDSDDSYPRLLETEFKKLDNVEVYPVGNDWDEWTSALRDILKRAKEGEWVCIDRADVAWEAVQDYYIRKVFGEEMGDYFLQARIEFEELLKRNPKRKNMVVLEGDKDWQVINKVYKQDWLKMISPTFPAHLYVVTSAAKIEERDEQEIKDIYTWVGLKPTGQKHLPYQVHTIFLFGHRKQRDWYITTIKDRGRKYFEGHKLVSLPHQYLMAVAWAKEE